MSSDQDIGIALREGFERVEKKIDELPKQITDALPKITSMCEFTEMYSDVAELTKPLCSDPRAPLLRSSRIRCGRWAERMHTVYQEGDPFRHEEMGSTRCFKRWRRLPRYLPLSERLSGSVDQWPGRFRKVYYRANYSVLV